MPIIDMDMVKEMAAKLSKAAASPEFLQLIQQVRDAPQSEKLQVVHSIAKLDTLRERGVPIPNGADFRVSPRTFEESEDEKSAEPRAYDLVPMVSFINGEGLVCFNGRFILVKEHNDDPTCS